MRTSQLEYFESVARNLSFTKAAEECHVAQPAISQQIQALERELGFSLFERTTRGVTLTEAGRAYRNDIAGILNALERSARHARAISSGSAGVLTVGIANSGQASMLGVLEEFSSRFPEIRVELHRVRSLGLRQQFARRDFDIALTAMPCVEDFPEIKLACVKRSPLRMTMSKGHPLARSHGVIPIDTIRDFPHIIADSEDDRFLLAAYPYLKDNPATPVIRAEDQGIVLASMLIGLGVAALPEDVVPSMNEGCVVREVEGYNASLEIGWGYLERADNAALEKFLEFLEAQN